MPPTEVGVPKPLERERGYLTAPWYLVGMWSCRLLIMALLVVPSAFAATPISPDVKKIVTFIFTSEANGSAVPRGTGFFVSVQDTENIYVYLVTAAHVLQDEAGKYYPTVWLRINTLKGGAEFARLDLITTAPTAILFVGICLLDLALHRNAPYTSGALHL